MQDKGLLHFNVVNNDDEIISVLDKVNDNETFKRAHAERNVLKVLEGDCETAVGAHAIVEGDRNYFRD